MRNLSRSFNDWQRSGRLASPPRDVIWSLKLQDAHRGRIEFAAVLSRGEEVGENIGRVLRGGYWGSQVRGYRSTIYHKSLTVRCSLYCVITSGTILDLDQRVYHFLAHAPGGRFVRGLGSADEAGISTEKCIQLHQQAGNAYVEFNPRVL